MMLKYDKGLAQDHTRKEQAQVKPGFLVLTSAACPILLSCFSLPLRHGKKQEAIEFGPLCGPPVSYKEVTLLEDPAG